MFMLLDEVMTAFFAEITPFTVDLQKLNKQQHLLIQSKLQFAQDKPTQEPRFSNLGGKQISNGSNEQSKVSSSQHEATVLKQISKEIRARRYYTLDALHGGKQRDTTAAGQPSPSQLSLRSSCLTFELISACVQK